MLPHKPSGPLQRSSSNILHHPQACRRQQRRRFHRLELSPPLPRNRRTPPRREDAQGAQCWQSPSGRSNRKGAAHPFQAPPTPPASAVESDRLHPHKGGAEPCSPSLTANRCGGSKLPAYFTFSRVGRGTAPPPRTDDHPSRWAKPRSHSPSPGMYSV